MTRSLLPRAALLSLASWLLLACTDLTAPAPYKPGKGETAAPAAEPPKPTKATVKPAAAQMEPGAQPADQPVADQEMIAAAHVLIAYQGAMRSQATRSKEEAQKLAEQIANDAKAGKDFAALAKQHSDDKGSAAKGGDLGRFPARRMVKQFADAASALKPGEISGAVESPFGFHVIRRVP